MSEIKTRELKLKVYDCKDTPGVDIVYDAAISSWLFKAGEYEFVEKACYTELLSAALQLRAALDHYKNITSHAINNVGVFTARDAIEDFDATFGDKQGEAEK